MVSIYPNPNPNSNPKPQEFYMDPMKMDLPGLDSLPANTIGTTTTTLSTTTNTTAFSLEDPNKKVRKPYTITKCRESWTDQEHEKFLEALQLFDRDWKKIEAFVGSKSVIQIRSHAQKYFLKVQKNGTSEHLPPPRPKRKASHPYPQKASKNAPMVSQVPGPFPSSAALLDPGYVVGPDSLAAPRNPVGNSDLTSRAYSTVPAFSASHVAKDDMGLTMPTAAHNCSYNSSNESTPRIWPTGDANDQEKGKHGNPMRVMPDFAQVYSFIGSVFDPNASGHLQKLQKMDPIDVETVLLLMKNLSANLTSHEFEDHRRLLSSYAVDSEKAKFSSRCNNPYSNNPQRAIRTV